MRAAELQLHELRTRGGRLRRPERPRLVLPGARIQRTSDPLEHVWPVLRIQLGHHDGHDHGRAAELLAARHGPARRLRRPMRNGLQSGFRRWWWSIPRETKRALKGAAAPPPPPAAALASVNPRSRRPAPAARAQPPPAPLPAPSPRRRHRNHRSGAAPNRRRLESVRRPRRSCRRPRRRSSRSPLEGRRRLPRPPSAGKRRASRPASRPTRSGRRQR